MSLWDSTRFMDLGPILKPKGVPSLSLGLLGNGGGVDVHPCDFALLYHHLPFKLMIGREPWGHHPSPPPPQLKLPNRSRVS